MQIRKPFEYFEPETVEQAVRILAKYGVKAKLLAGGVDLVRRMRRHQIEPECVVYLQRIPDLDYIESDGVSGLRVGALTTLRSLELSPVVQRDYAVLYDAIHQIASIQVKSMGTAVGNLCVGTPASDVALPLLVLAARLKLLNTDVGKTIPIDDLFVGPGQIVLQPDEMITEILVPSPPAGNGGAFLKLVRTASDIAKVNVAVMVVVRGGRCREARIALGSVAPTPFRAKKAEEILVGQKLEQKMIEAAAEAASEETEPITDIRSTAEYRKRMARVLTRRAIEKALARAAS